MHRRLRRIIIVLVAIGLVLVAARLALDPLAAWRTRHMLAGLEGMRATFASVRVRLLDLSYEIDHLRIEKRAEGGAALPFVQVRQARFGLQGKELLHMRLVARAELLGPKLTLVETPTPEGERGRKPGQKIAEAPRVIRRLSARAPVLVDRVEVKDGEILWIDAADPKAPRLWVHGIEATLENFATRPALARGEPTVLAMRAVLQRSGKLSVFATADPLAKKLTFAGQGRVQGLRLEELGELLAAKTGVTPDKGTLDMSLRFRAEGGRLSGGVRPVLNDAGTRPARPGLGAKIKSALADTSLKIFSDNVPGRRAVATTIPIEGRMTDPDVQLVPTILGIVRNAFVRGLADSIEGLPPPKARQQQGVLEQARRALSPGKGHRPKAQPAKGRQ